MIEEQNLPISPDGLEALDELLQKAKVVNEKTEKSANVRLHIGNLIVPIRVDDVPLLYIGASLLPNILNYLVNILPQFLYPYVVAYLQDFSASQKDPVTINDLYDVIKNYGNVRFDSETESKTVGVQQNDQL